MSYLQKLMIGKLLKNAELYKILQTCNTMFDLQSLSEEMNNLILIINNEHKKHSNSVKHSNDGILKKRQEYINYIKLLI